jgi:hypothetical protein
MTSINVVVDPVHGEIVTRAQKRVADATVVCFLGFGYHPDNLQRLGVATTIPNDSYHFAFGSACNLDDGYKLWIKDRVPAINLGDRHENCLQVLKRFHVFRD